MIKEKTTRLSLSYTQRLAWLSLFLSLGVVLYVIEAIYLNTPPFPGAKLGLANLITLLILTFFDWKESLVNVIMRTLLGSLITGTFLSTSFFFSLVGGLVSCLVMIAVFKSLYGKLSLVGVSLGGATFHNFSQLVLASFLVRQLAVFLQLPFLLLFATFSGMINGILANLVAARLRVNR